MHAEKGVNLVRNLAERNWATRTTTTTTYLTKIDMVVVVVVIMLYRTLSIPLILR